MFNINCIDSKCIFENEGKCTLTHISSPSNYYNPDCLYFRPKEEYKVDGVENKTV